MQDEPVTLQLGTLSTNKGIEVLAITAGIGNGWIFQPAVLQASAPLWDKAECYTDHISSRPGTPGNHSVRDLGGILSNPQWDETAQGVRAVLTPTGPAAQVVRDLADAALAHPALPIGLSADTLNRPDMSPRKSCIHSPITTQGLRLIHVAMSHVRSATQFATVAPRAHTNKSKKACLQN